jgi:gamma-glutamyl:cysteine ligase YbdK (ATP-grasp superfamily)
MGVAMEKRFGSSALFTIGLEEEFQLVDPSTKELAAAVEGVLDAAPAGSERIAPELFQDCVEMRTPASRPSRSWPGNIPRSGAKSRRRRRRRK